MGFHKPLIRPAISWGVPRSFGGGMAQLGFPMNGSDKESSCELGSYNFKRLIFHKTFQVPKMEVLTYISCM